jgi:hypothetical protein
MNIFRPTAAAIVNTYRAVAMGWQEMSTGPTRGAYKTGQRMGQGGLQP